MSLCLLVLHVAYLRPRLNPLVKDLQAAGRIRYTIHPLQLSRSLLHSGPEREARPDLRSRGQSNQTQPCSCLSASQSCEKLFLEPSADTNPEGWRDSLLSWSQRGAWGLSVPALSGGASPGIHSRPADGVIAPAPLLFPTQAGGPTYSLYLLLYNNFGNSHGS